MIEVYFEPGQEVYPFCLLYKKDDLFVWSHVIFEKLSSEESPWAEFKEYPAVDISKYTKIFEMEDI